MTDHRRDELARRLRALAVDVASGSFQLPRCGVGPDSSGGLVVPAVVHDLLCGWRVRTLHNTPGVSTCAGCGLAVPVLPGRGEPR